MRGKRRAEYLCSQDIKLFCYGEKAETLNFNLEHELSPKDLNIGKGKFGVVYKGFVNGQDAAFKRSRKIGTGNDILMEAKILSHIGFHSNIVRFLGTSFCNFENGNFYIVTELCCNGSLKNFLRKLNLKSKSLATNTRSYTSLSHLLNRFCFEIANGMSHITEMQIVHRDLATRNVFLDGNLECKIGDFLISCKQNDNSKEKSQEGLLLPWRWMAYESLSEYEFSSMSDVWSYGVTAWEIYSLGQKPYTNMNWTSNFVKELRNGMRLPLPLYSPEIIFSKIQECWNIRIEQRPIFKDLATFFLNSCSG